MEAIEELERKVQAATRELSGLRRQNRSLKSKVKKLEEAAGAAAAAGGETWAQERENLRRRVTKLADDLESVLSA